MLPAGRGAICLISMPSTRRSDRLLKLVGGSAAVASDSGQPVVLVFSPLLQPGPCHSSAGSLAYARPIRDAPVNRQQRQLVPLGSREEHPLRLFPRKRRLLQVRQEDYSFVK